MTHADASSILYLGPLPERHTPVRSRQVTAETYPLYDVEMLVLDLNDTEPVPAYFVKPHIQGNSPLPVILYNHASSVDMAIGKDELLFGSGSLCRPPYAEALAKAGIASLCIDMWGSGERRGRNLDELFKTMIWYNQVLWGMMVYDNLRAVDYLLSRHDVDASRIGTLGLSLGSTMAWWTAALSPEIRVCVDICCLTDYQALIRSRGLNGHGVYYYVPDLLNHFTTGEINALIAPRPHLGLAGLYDPLTPADGLESIDSYLRSVYSGFNAADCWRLSVHPCGHLETTAMRGEIMNFLTQWL